MKQKHFLKRLLAGAMMAVMLVTSAPVGAASQVIDLSGKETVIEAPTDLSDSFPDGEMNELPEITDTPQPPQIEDPSETTDDETPESEDPAVSKPEFEDGEAVVLNSEGGAKSSRAIQKLSKHKGYPYYHPFRHNVTDWSSVTIGGQNAYCVDLTNFNSSSGVDMGSSTVYDSLTYDQKYVIGHIMQFGAPDASNVEWHIATQTLIWEVVHGRIDLKTMKRVNDDIYNGTVGYNPGAVPYYDQIWNQVKEYEQVPSFMAPVQVSAPTYRMPGSSSHFELELKNDNSKCSLSEFNFTSSGGIQIDKEGETLKLSSSQELSTPVLISAYKGASGQTDSLLFWTGGNQQTRATPLQTNPVPAYCYIGTNDIGAFTIEINKVQYGTNLPLESAVFQVRHTEKGIVGDVTSGPDGKAIVTVPWEGSYIVTELTPPKNHLLDENPMKDVVVNEENQHASVTFANKPYTGIRVLKVDAGNSRPLAGAVISLEQIDGDIRLEGTTNENGEVFFNDLPVGTSWRVRELQAPAGYHLNEQVFTAELVENQVMTITIPDKIKSGLVIRKVDAQTGKPLAGAVFTVTRSDGKLIGEYISDQNGLIVIESLPEDTYIVEEIQPPEGYLLDGENSKKTIRHIWESNQELVFRDHPKPKLLIQKIDEDTGKALEGAVIRVSRRGSSEYTEVTTGKDGTALLEGLEEDWYQVQEIRSPNGYILDDTVHDVELKVGETASIVLTNKKEPTLQIKKIKAEDGAPLAGAVFRVTLPNGATKDVTTGQDGIASIPFLEAGEAVIKEIKAPDGYLLDETEHHIRLEAGKTAEIVIKNSQKSSLLVKKIDSVTGQPMEGVKFSVSVKNGKPLGEFITDENGEIFLSGVTCDLEAGTILVVTEIDTLDGYLLDKEPREVLLEPDITVTVQFENEPINPLLIKKVDQDGQPLAGVKFRVKRADGEYVGEYTTGISGLAVVAGQKPGYYVVEEIQTIDGYLLDSTPKTVKLTKDKPAEVEFVNHKAASLLIKKIDSVTGQALAGAVFKVTTSSGTLLAEVTTGYNGYATLDGLKPGTVIVSEIKGPDGYLLDNTPHTVVLKKGETAVVEIQNTPQSILEIQKVDSVTGKPLAGVTFEVEKLSGERIGTFVTDARGRIIIPGLTPQWLVVRETETVKGYRLDSDPINVEVKSGKTTVVKLKNYPYPILDLRKIDADTEKPMSGVKFKLLDNSKRELGSFTTNEDGKITLTGISGDTTVYLQEVETQKGYELDDTLYPVTLHWGKTSSITIKNHRIYGKIQIQKIAADASVLGKNEPGDPLEGAVFEIYNEKGKLVDTMTTDKDGKAVSKKLPLGSYVGKEVTAPKFFLLNDQSFSFKIKKQDQLIKVTMKDESKKPEVEIEKRGNVEAQPGQTMQYTLSNIQNQSNCALDKFYFEDVLPAEAVRLNTIHTGTYSEILTYKVLYKTNLTSDYRVLADNLSTQINNTLSCSPSALGLAANEYITAVRFDFGTVQKRFASKDNPVFEVSVLPGLEDGHRIQNSVVISGSCDGVPVYDKSVWVTVVVAKPNGPLPKTGAVVF